MPLLTAASCGIQFVVHLIDFFMLKKKVIHIGLTIFHFAVLGFHNSSFLQWQLAC